jgi:hypothetical protein
VDSEQPRIDAISASVASSRQRRATTSAGFSHPPEVVRVHAGQRDPGLSRPSPDGGYSIHDLTARGDLNPNDPTCQTPR